jgi:hypothetical protein
MARVDHQGCSGQAERLTGSGRGSAPPDPQRAPFTMGRPFARATRENQAARVRQMTATLERMDFHALKLGWGVDTNRHAQEACRRGQHCRIGGLCLAEHCHVCERKVLVMFGKKKPGDSQDYTRVCGKCGTHRYLPKAWATEKSPSEGKVNRMNRAARIDVGGASGISLTAMNLSSQRDRVLTNARCGICGSSDFTQYAPGESISGQ